MLHAHRWFATFYVMEADDEGPVDVMFIGPAFNGQMLEAGVIEDEEDPRIIHAMKARPKFWPSILTLK